MNSLQLLRTWCGEIYLTASVLLCWVMSGTLLNPFYAFLTCILAILIVFKNRIFGVILSTVFLFINLYMVLALISELNEFQTFNSGARDLVVGGTLYIGSNIAVSIIMLIKWSGITFNNVRTT